MKYLGIIPLALAASCASRPQLGLRPSSLPSIQPVEAIRYAETVRAYHLGRYVDPNQPETMHEQHPVYRIEASAHWNLHAGSPHPVNVVPNPPPEAAFAPPPTNDVVIAEMNRQRETTALVMRQAARLTQSYDELQRLLIEMKNVVRDNAILSARLANAEERLANLEKELWKLNPPPPSPANEVPAFSVKSPEPLKP